MAKNFKKLKKVFADDPEMLRKLAHEEMMNATKEKSAVEIALHLKKGDPGNDGYTPKKGKDYFTASEIEDVAQFVKQTVKSEVTPQKGKDYFDGTPGRDADEARIIRSVMRQMPTLEDIAAAVKLPEVKQVDTMSIIDTVLKSIPSPYIPTIEDIVAEIKKK